MTGGAERRTRAAPLRQREFRLLFFGQTISAFGDKLVPVALAFGVLDLTGSVADLGFVIAAAELPNVALVLLAGVFGDRLPRQRLMLGADIVRALAQAATAAVFLTGQGGLALLIVLQVIYGSGSALFSPASTGLVPRLVAKDDLQQANSLLHLTRNVVGIGGPAAAGVIVAVSNPGVAMAVDAATFIGSAVFLARMKLPTAVQDTPTSTSVRRELAEGWGEFTSRRWVWVSVATFGLYQLSLFPAMSVLGPAVANNSLGGASAWAAVLTAGVVGSIVGNVLALRYKPRRLLLASHLLSAAVALPLAFLALGGPLAAIIATNGLAWAGLSIADALWFTALQTHIPDHALARVSSYDWLGSVALNPLGFGLIGPIAAVVGTETTLAAAAFVAMGAPVAALTVRSVREISREAPGAAA
jgi:predicted MFS family arabinose efflux permease